MLRVAEAVVEYFEDELVAFFAIFAHKRVQVFHGGGFEGLVAVQLKDFADGVEDITAFADGGGIEVAGALGQGGFIFTHFWFGMGWPYLAMIRSAALEIRR